MPQQTALRPSSGIRCDAASKPPTSAANRRRFAVHGYALHGYALHGDGPHGLGRGRRALLLLGAVLVTTGLAVGAVDAETAGHQARAWSGRGDQPAIPPVGAPETMPSMRPAGDRRDGVRDELQQAAERAAALYHEARAERAGREARHRGAQARAAARAQIAVEAQTAAAAETATPLTAATPAEVGDGAVEGGAAAGPAVQTPDHREPAAPSTGGRITAASVAAGEAGSAAPAVASVVDRGEPVSLPPPAPPAAAPDQPDPPPPAVELLTPAGVAAPNASVGAATVRLFELVNAERVAVGAPVLAWDAGLAGAAEHQARRIAADGALYHQDLSPILGLGWGRAAENVGEGPGVDSLHRAFVASAAHHQNMVGTGFLSVGIGVVTTAEGRLWVAAVFGG